MPAAGLEWLSFLLDPYVRFSSMLIGALLLPISIGFRRGAPAPSKAAAVAAVAMIAVIAGTLALGIRSLELLIGAVLYQYITFFAAAAPFIARRDFLSGPLLIAEFFIFSLLNNLLSCLFP